MPTMSSINIKIDGFDESSNTVLVKFASDLSLLPIEEYSSMGFQIIDPAVTTAEEFAQSIRTAVTYHVAVRDALESHVTTLDLDSWMGFTTTITPATLVDPALTPQLVEGLTNPEVEL
jgi:long-subunit fatty acid transport protein